ncbi:MAG: hypothetical protein ABSB81_11200 [Halobacteriota archaeon]|jgi:hypothetical protein
MNDERNVKSAEDAGLTSREESEVAIKPPADKEDVQEKPAEIRQLAKDFYENLKENPDIWRSAALKFKRVADLVSIEVDKDEEGRLASQVPPIDDIYIFLMSVAIENILKGLLMASGKVSYEDVTKNHDIAALYGHYCEKFGLPVTEDEGLLHILALAAVWVGRFNLPRSSKQLEDAMKRHGLTMDYKGYGLSISLLYSKDVEAEPGELKAAREKINALYERLYAHFIIVSGPNRT